MQITIYRGTKEIGGSCVELSSGKTRIILDFGIPLVDEDGNSFDSDKIKSLNQEELIDQKILPDIRGLYKNDIPQISAIFISHAHPDHFGFLSFVHPDIPIYASEVTKNIILEISTILYEYHYDLPNFKHIKGNESIQIDNVTLKALNVDHSVPGSLAFKIDHNDKTILYTGDIRAHGRQDYLFKNLSKNINKIDYMIMEGTTLGREGAKTLREEEVEMQLAELFKIDKLNIITFSAQNLDRFISVYKACLRSKKTLVIDPYTAYLLEKFKVLSQNIPQFDWNNIKIYFAPNRITKKLADTQDLYKYKAQKISIKEIMSNPSSYIIKDNRIITRKILELTDFDDIQVIYSLWSGYLEREDNSWYPYKDKLIQVHTSGHACINDLKILADRVNPSHIIPIHTLYPESYREIFGDKTLILQDGQVIDL